MKHLGELVGKLTPTNPTNGIFGNPVSEVTVYQSGVELTRRKGPEQYLFAEIEKITAGGYASASPVEIRAAIVPKGGKAIAFTLSSNRRDINLLLDVHCDYLLGGEFPRNIGTLDLDLGGKDESLRLTKGSLYLSKQRIPAGALTDFSTNAAGYYELAVRGLSRKPAIAPENAPNILASIKILSVLVELSSRAEQRSSSRR
jgi:hypothetical protein